MKTFDNLGFTAKVTKDTLSVEISIDNLANAFELSPNNYDESTVKSNKKNNFAEFVAQKIVEECDSETGDTPLTIAFDTVFDLLLEGYDDGREFIDFKD